MNEKYSVLPQTKWTAPSLFTIDPKPLAMLLCALTLIGVGDGLFVLANMGSSPWTVLAQGVSLQANISIGWASLWISGLVMLLWIPLRLRFGLGTILNILVIAFVLGLSVEQLPPAETFALKWVYLAIGLLLFGIGSALYLTCHMGAGPRDGLMVGLCYRFHWKVGLVRTLIEILVCVVGFFLGGTVGVATLLFALGVGWVVQVTLYFIRLFTPQNPA